MTLKRLTLAALLIVCVQPAIVRAQVSVPSLKLKAATAGLEGKTAISFFTMCECVEVVGILSVYSAWVVTPKVSPATVVTPGDRYVETWHTFQVQQVLASRPLAPESFACRPLPDEISLGTGEVALPVWGGTAIVDGIAVTEMTGMESVVFKPGSQYLVLAFACPSGVLGQYDNRYETLEIADDGRLAPLPGFTLRQSTFVTLGIFTLQALIERLR